MMKRVAYADANSLTVAGSDFPFTSGLHFLFSFFLPQIFKCLGQTGVRQSRDLKHRVGALESSRLLKGHLQTVVTDMDVVSGLARLEEGPNVYSRPLTDSDI